MNFKYFLKTCQNSLRAWKVFEKQAVLINFKGFVLSYNLRKFVVTLLLIKNIKNPLYDFIFLSFLICD